MSSNRAADGNDWPPEAAARRGEVLREIELLLEETDPQRQRTLVTQLNLADVNREQHDQGRAVLTIARMLLAGPCPFRELLIAGLLCKVGIGGMTRPYRRALAPIPRDARSTELAEARIGFLAAFGRYADAARAMNGACGTVIFFDLEAPLGGA